MTPSSPSPGPRYEALLQVLRTAETLWESSRLFFDRWNLSPSQFNVLNLLRDSPEGSNQTDLSRALIMHRSNLTGLIDRLEKRGLVSRKPAPKDRRAHCVVLTAEGQRLVDEILPAYYQAAEQVWGTLPATRASQLANDLTAIGQNAMGVVRFVT